MKTIDSAVRLQDDPKAVEAWLARAEECHIHHSVVAPTDARVAVLNDDGNRQMTRLAKAHPRTFSGLAVANPWYGTMAVDTLRRAFDEGLAGLYLHPMRQGFRLTESLLDPRKRGAAPDGTRPPLLIWTFQRRSGIFFGMSKGAGQF